VAVVDKWRGGGGEMKLVIKGEVGLNQRLDWLHHHLLHIAERRKIIGSVL